jgi:glycosyltransferase involved in cell wall biosynthesis
VTRRHRVVCVSPILPWPLDRGNRVRVFNLITEVAARHETIAVLQHSPQDAAQGVEDARSALEAAGVSVRLVGQPNVGPKRLAMRLAYEARRIMNGTLVEEYYLNTRVFRKFVSLVVAETAPDVVIVEYFYCGMPDVATLGVPVVCDTHDVMWENAASTRGIAGRRLAALQTRERNTLGRFAGVICVHERDLEVVSSMLGYQPTSEVIATTRQRETIPYSAHTGGSGRVVGFYGAFNSRMNLDALDYLLRAVWPRVLKLVPDAGLVVFGSGGDSLKESVEAHQATEYLGALRNVEDGLERMDVLLMPLRMGSGIKGRVLEAMEHGVPVVGTSVTFDGIPITPGREGVVAESAEGLAAEVARLLLDGTHWENISQSARLFFERSYGWQETYGRVHRLLERVAPIS